MSEYNDAVARIVQTDKRVKELEQLAVMSLDALQHSTPREDWKKEYENTINLLYALVVDSK